VTWVVLLLPLSWLLLSRVNQYPLNTATKLTSGGASILEQVRPVAGPKVV